MFEIGIKVQAKKTSMLRFADIILAESKVDLGKLLDGIGKLKFG